MILRNIDGDTAFNDNNADQFPTYQSQTEILPLGSFINLLLRLYESRPTIESEFFRTFKNISTGNKLSISSLLNTLLMEEAKQIVEGFHQQTLNPNFIQPNEATKLEMVVEQCRELAFYTSDKSHYEGIWRYLEEQNSPIKRPSEVSVQTTIESDLNMISQKHLRANHTITELKKLIEPPYVSHIYNLNLQDIHLLFDDRIGRIVQSSDNDVLKGARESLQKSAIEILLGIYATYPLLRNLQPGKIRLLGMKDVIPFVVEDQNRAGFFAELVRGSIIYPFFLVIKRNFHPWESEVEEIFLETLRDKGKNVPQVYVRYGRDLFMEYVGRHRLLSLFDDKEAETLPHQLNAEFLPIEVRQRRLRSFRLRTLEEIAKALYGMVPIIDKIAREYRLKYHPLRFNWTIAEQVLEEEYSKISEFLKSKGYKYANAADEKRESEQRYLSLKLLRSLESGFNLDVGNTGMFDFISRYFNQKSQERIFIWESKPPNYSYDIAEGIKINPIVYEFDLHSIRPSYIEETIARFATYPSFLSEEDRKNFYSIAQRLSGKPEQEFMLNVMYLSFWRNLIEAAHRYKENNYELSSGHFEEARKSLAYLEKNAVPAGLIKPEEMISVFSLMQKIRGLYSGHEDYFASRN